MAPTTWCNMLLPKGLLFSACLITLAAGAAVKVPPGAGWASFSPKSVYSRALGPPAPAMQTITVPYMPKSPLFPKFVDPKMMISKKTDMLSNLFGGLGPAYPPGFKPFAPYGASGAAMYNVGDGSDMFMGKTLGLSEDSSKTKISDGSSGFKRGIFGPFSPKFGPMGPKFGPMGPMSQFGGPDMMPDYSMKDSFSRKRRSIDESSATNLRSIMGDSKPATKDLGPPPPYPTLPPISEEPEEENSLLLSKMDGTGVPKEYMPGMFGPFGPVIDPSMFIAKKSAFLDTLFKTLATTTTTEAPISTEAPVPKSTIVPPSFWFPTSIIPSPTDYNAKVAEFLDKLFESLKLNKTGISTDESMSPTSDLSGSLKSDADTTQARIARSVEDLSSINTAKDTIIDTILSELSDLKGDMVTTMNDLITYQKSQAATMLPKKPFKPFASSLWPKPTPDAMLPFQQRMAVLSQVFDMLTDLQKNITMGIQNAIKAKMATPENVGAPSETNVPLTAYDSFSTSSNLPINVSLLDAIKSKLSTLDTATPAPSTLSSYKFGPKAVRMLPKTPSSFWVSYPEDTASTAKRQVEENPMSTSMNEESDNDRNDRRQYTRAVQMQMHQGYQSLPAGSVESVQAGGGSVPGHQGGGIKLLDTSSYGDINKWADWMEYLKNENQGRRHHNHH